MRMFWRLSAALCLLFGAPALANAQGSFPDRPVKFIVAFPPGGATDTFFRQIANDVSAALGQPAIIENRGGGGGYIAWQQVANAEPDGYTLLVAENALGISQALYKNHPSKFDPLKQYDAIAATGSTPLVLTAANNTSFNTFAELVAYSKSLPQKLNYAHAGAGSVTHLSFEVIRDGAGMDTVPVPYKGGGPAVADTVAGHVPITMASLSVAKPLVESGKLKGLFVTSPQRSPALPNVPSVKEINLKYADVDLEFWWGIFGPKGIPAPVREKLEKAFQSVMANPAVRERLTKVDTNPTFTPGAALRVKLENEIKNWSTFIDAKGIKVE